MLALAIAAFFTVISGIIAQGLAWGWAQGFSIYIAIVVIVSITSANDWVKDKSFVRLQSESKNEDIAVIRGKFGATQSVNIYDLVVGDIVLLETGCRVPADCVLIDGQDITVDETFYNKDNRRATKKLVATADNFDECPDSILLANSLVATGSGKAVVCAVGARSRRGIHEEKLDTTSKTPLQVKLQNLGGTFTKYAIIAAGVILVAYIVNFILRISTMA